MSEPPAAELRVALCEKAIDEARLWRAIADPDCGAQMVFLGTTRRATGSKITSRLVYDAYRAMAAGELRRLAEEAAGRWPLAHLVLVHRLGEVAVGEASVAVAASSAHRPPVMEAIPWVMDELKRRVPIWKQEHGPDGAAEWVHP